MKPETTEDVLELMDGYAVSAALGTAMELGIFWLLAEKPLSAANVAQSLNIPLNRCHHWLQLLCKLGLLENNTEGYAPSIARKAILNAQSQDTWAFQARENRDSSLSVRDLALNIGKPMSTWQARNLTPSDKLRHVCHRRFWIHWNIRHNPSTLQPRRWCKLDCSKRVFGVFL